MFEQEALLGVIFIGFFIKNIYIYIYFKNCACSAILKLGFCVVWMKALLGTDFGGVFVYVGTLDWGEIWFQKKAEEEIASGYYIFHQINDLCCLKEDSGTACVDCGWN